MPTTTAAELINRAGVALTDTGNVRWTRAELLAYLSAGQREIVIRKPNAYVLRSSVPLVAGTVQALPTTVDNVPVDPIQLVDVLRNATGRAVRRIERDLMDQLNPDWHLTPQGKLVQHYMFSDLDPKRFLVYPPNDGTGCLDIAYSATPPALTSEFDALTLDDIYQDALLDYCLYRAFSKDAEYAADPTRAAARYASFAQAIDSKAAHESADSPQRTRR
jgi:hypothetical protein